MFQLGEVRGLFHRMKEDGDGCREKKRSGLSAWGLVSALAFVTSLVSVAGLAGRSWWVLDVSSSFRFQFFVVLLILGAALAAGGKYRQSLGCLGLAALNLAFVLPCWLDAGRIVETPGSVRLKGLLVNVHTANTRHEEVRQLVEQVDPDVAVFEEVDVSWVHGLAGLLVRYPHNVFCTRPDNFGIGLVSRRPFRKTDLAQLGMAGVPSVYVELDLGEGRTLHVVGTHPLPPVDAEYWALRNDQLDCVAQYVARLKGPVLLLGDLNTPPWSPFFRQFTRQSGLRDCSRGRGLNTTWPTFFGLMRIPIDHAMVSPGVVVLSERVGPGIG